MKIFIESEGDKFTLHNILHLNWDDIESHFTDISYVKDGEEFNKDAVLCEIKLEDGIDYSKYDRLHKLEKILDTIKLAFKLGVIK